ncbi:efflux RND transporter permease subunit [candidate division KSB1 bacterium]|nr:efflux RND transporter permease subunit [candidate division KSB1 bacterium]
MKLLRSMIDRPIAVMMLYLIFLVAGILSLLRLPLELMPDVEFPRLSVSTHWPNSSAEIVESFITAPIEAVCSGIKGVSFVSSSSEEGQSIITAEFTRGTNMDFAALELNEKLALVRDSLPHGASSPAIVKYVPKEFATGTLLSFYLYGDMPSAEIRRTAMTTMRGKLLSVRGVSAVQVVGGVEPVILIEMNPTLCQALNIEANDVSRAIREMRGPQSVGMVDKGDTRYTLRVENSITANDLENLEIQIGSQRCIRIADIGRVRVTHENPNHLRRLDGKPAIVIDIHKEAGANIIKTANRVYARIEEMKSQLDRLHFLKMHDQSEQIRIDLKVLASRALFSIMVIFLVLRFFLHGSSPLIILSTIFYALLITGILLLFAHMSLNILTLAGLALGFGMTVDNSVVVLDTIYHHHEMGYGAREASLLGCRQVFLPVLASTATTLAALAPLFYVQNEFQLYYHSFALAVSLSLLASLFVAFSLIPMLASRILPLSGSQKQGFGLDHLLAGKMVRWCLRYRALLLPLLLIILVGTGYLFTFIPRGSVWHIPERNGIDVAISMPEGADVGITDALAQEFERTCLADGLIERVTCEIFDEHALLQILFPEELERTGYPIILKEKLMMKAAGIGGVSVGVYGYGEGFQSGETDVMPLFNIKVLGYDYVRVKTIAEAVGKRLAQFARIHDIDTNSKGWSSREDASEMAVILNRENLNRHRMTCFAVLDQIQGHLRESARRHVIRLNDREYQLQLKMQGAEQFDLQQLRQLKVQNGHSVRLTDVADVRQRTTMPRIERENQQYQRLISFAYRGSSLQGQQFVDSIIKTTQLPAGFKLQGARTWGWMTKKETSQIEGIIALALLLVFMVTAALFESLRLPFLIILSIPLAMIGVVAIHLLTGRSLDRGAYIGIVLLSGIVVNNAILLVSHIQTLILSGVEQQQAVVQAALDRLRPILMTSLTTIVGLVPLIIQANDGSMWSSLALTTASGLTASTFLILLAMPALYTVFAK